MSVYEQLKNPPITEALIDIRIDRLSHERLPELRALQEAIAKEYPNTQERVSWTGRVQWGPGREPSLNVPAAGPDGYLFHSSQRQKIFQVRLDGFTFHHLKPYPGWDQFLPEAKQLWTKYMAVAKPQRVVRVALRYLNRIEIPLPCDDLKKYLRIIPALAPELPQELHEFVMRLVVRKSEKKLTGIVTEVLEPKQFLNKIAVILDLDVFCDQPLGLEGDGLWQLIDDLKVFRGDLFLQSITDETKELFR